MRTLDRLIRIELGAFNVAQRGAQRSVVLMILKEEKGQEFKKLQTLEFRQQNDTNLRKCRADNRERFFCASNGRPRLGSCLNVRREVGGASTDVH